MDVLRPAYERKLPIGLGLKSHSVLLTALDCSFPTAENTVHTEV